MAFFSIRKIDIIKAVDRSLGTLLARILPAARRPSVIEQDIERVLFIRPGGLGDALLLVPVIELFAKRYPETKIDILAEARNKAAFGFLHNSHTIELYTDPTVFWQLSQRRYDVIIDTEQWYRFSAIYARLLHPNRLVGFATNERARMLTDKIDYNLDDYELLSFFRLLEPLEVVPDASEMVLRLWPDDEALAKAEHLLGSNRTGPMVGVFPGASLPEKRWPTENYCALVKALQAGKATVIIVGGDSERGVAAEIASKTGCMNTSGRTSLTETAGILARLDLLITGDSALLHLAAGLNTSTLSLFGPSNPKKWAPPGERHVSLQKKFDCVPCSRYGHIPHCPYEVKCLIDLVPEDVLRASWQLLSETGVRNPNNDADARTQSRTDYCKS